MLDVLEKSLTFFLNLSPTIVVKNNDIFSHLIPNYFELIRRLCYFLRPFYPRGKEPTQELYSSSRRTAVVPLFKNCMHFFGYISGLGNVASPSSNEHGSWWASNEHPTFRLRGGDVTTSPSLPQNVKF